MSNIQKLNISLLKNYKNNFNSEKSNFKNNAYNTFSSSYLRNCSDDYVIKMGNNLFQLFNDIETAYKKIDNWWENYNENVESLEKYLSGQGGLGSITESSIRGFVNSKLYLLEEYKKKNNANFKTPTIDLKFTIDTVKNNFSSLFSDYKDVSDKVNNKLKEQASIINEHTKTTVSLTDVTSDITKSVEKNKFDKYAKKMENIMGISPEPITKKYKETNAKMKNNNVNEKELADSAFEVFKKVAPVLLTSLFKSDGSKKEEEKDLLTQAQELWDSGVEQAKNFHSDISKGAQELWDSGVENFEKAKSNFSKGASDLWDAYIDHHVQLNNIQMQQDMMNYEAAKQTVAFIGTSTTSLGEGFLEFGESMFDSAMIFGAYKADADYYSNFSNYIANPDAYLNHESTVEMVKPTVEKEYVKTAFDDMYNNTEYGQFLKNNTYGFDTVRTVGNGVGYTSGVVVTAGFTGGGNVAMVGTAGLAGFGNSTEQAWLDGATTEEGVMYGLASGTWEGIQFGVGAKIGNLSPFSSNTMNSLTRVGLDSLDGAAEGFVQPALQGIYKDGSYDDLFIENGGWNYVFTNAAIGGGSSVLGEAFDVSRFFKTEDVKNIDIETKPEIEIDNVSKTQIEQNIDNINNTTKLTMDDFKYQNQNPVNSVVAYLQSNFRKFVYNDTSNFMGVNERILNQDLYHFSESVDQILESGYVKPSGLIDSYGNKKSFFFSGVPEVGNYVNNLDKLPLKTTAVRVEASVGLINDPKLKIRNIDDGAITYDGQFDLNGLNTNKEYFCLFKENDELVYKSVSEDFFNNYENTTEGKILAEFISDKNNIRTIRDDYYVNLSLKNTGALKNEIQSKLSSIFDSLRPSPQFALAGTGATVSVSQIDDILENINLFKRNSNNVELDINNGKNFIDSLTDENAVAKANINTAKGYFTSFKFSGPEKLPDIDSDFWKNIENRDLVTIIVNGREMSFDDAISYKKNYDLNLKDDINITEELITEELLDVNITEELMEDNREIKIDNSIKEKIEKNIVNSAENNQKLLKTEILATVSNISDPVEKLRKLYMELNNRVHYDMKYIVGDKTTKTAMMEMDINFDTISNNNVICKGWSQLYKELLIDAGFDPNKISINGTSHNWIEVDLGDNILIADATESVNGNNIDLVSSKSGFSTNGFIILDKSYSGLRLKQLSSNLDFTQYNSWLKQIDENLGYATIDGYYGELVEKTKNLFGNVDSSNKILDNSFEQNINKIFDMEIPSTMDGYEGWAYYKKIKEILFSKEEASKINTSFLYNLTSSKVEPIAILQVNDPKFNKILVYSESTGKMIFDNNNDYIKYRESLNLITKPK